MRAVAFFPGDNVFAGDFEDPPGHVATKGVGMENLQPWVIWLIFAAVFIIAVADYYTAITKLAQTSLRNLIGDLDLDDALTSRELINTKLREILDDATDKWGTRVSRVEIQRIEPPKDVTEAMHRQMKAERDRRAIILESEGEKQAKILRAEGERDAEIQRAVGQAEAIRKVADARRYELVEVAEGEAGAIKTVFGAIHEGDPTNDLIAIRYLDTLARVADGKASKIFLPLEVSGILGSIGGIAELFGGEKEPPPHPETV